MLKVANLCPISEPSRAESLSRKHAPPHYIGRRVSSRLTDEIQFIASNSSTPICLGFGAGSLSAEAKKSAFRPEKALIATRVPHFRSRFSVLDDNGEIRRGIISMREGPFVKTAVAAHGCFLVLVLAATCALLPFALA